MVRVHIDGYVLPVINELTGVVSRHFFVPIEKDSAQTARLNVEDDCLEDIVLAVQSYGPPLTEPEQKKERLQLQGRFTGMYLRELNEAQSRRLRGVAYLCDAAASASFMAGTGALALESFLTLESFPTSAIVEALASVQSALIAGLFALHSAKVFRDASVRHYTGIVTDHFSTNLDIEQGREKDIHEKVLALHTYFDALHGPSWKINKSMADEARRLDLSCVQQFYEKRIDKKNVEGAIFKLFDKGVLRSFIDGFRKWFTGEEYTSKFVEHIGKRIATAAPQKHAQVHVPIILLPSFDGYDVLVDHRFPDLSDLATRIGQGVDVDIMFDVYTPHDLEEDKRALLEQNLPCAIHDNIYRKSRIFNVIPKKAIETGSRLGRYIGAGMGTLITAGGILAVVAGNPLAGTAIIIPGAYAVVRQLLFSRPLERAAIAPYKRLIEGYDALQERLFTTNTFTYHADPSLDVFDRIITAHALATHASPYAAYVACVEQAKQLDWPDAAANYISKALSVQPVEHEKRPGIMEIKR